MSSCHSRLYSSRFLLLAQGILIGPKRKKQQTCDYQKYLEEHETCAIGMPELKAPSQNTGSRSIGNYRASKDETVDRAESPQSEVAKNNIAAGGTDLCVRQARWLP
jgi:hypothetical protein